MLRRSISRALALFLIVPYFALVVPAQLSTTSITGTVTLPNGAIATGAQLKVFKIVKNGAVISKSIQTFTLKSDGTWSPPVNLVRDSVAYIYLNAPGFDQNPTTGTPVVIPDASSAALTSLQAAVSVPSQVPVAIPPGNISVSTSTRAGLNNSDPLGSITYVTDDVGGAWQKGANGYFSLSGERVNVKEFGALGTGKVVSDGAMSSSSNTSTLTCSTSHPFTSAMVGWLIDVEGAGASATDIHGVSGHNNLTGTITGFTSSSVVTVSFTCLTTVSGAKVTFTPNDSTAILAAKTAAGAGGHLHFPRGIYGLTQEVALLSGQLVTGDANGGSIILMMGCLRNSATGAFNAFKINDGITDVTIADLSIRGSNYSGQAPTTIAAYSFAVKMGSGAGGKIENITIRHCELAYSWGMGFRSDGDNAQTPGVAPSVLNIKIHDCYVHHNSDNGLNPHACGGLEIARCTLTYNGAAGIEIAASRYDIHDNYIAFNRLTGAALGGLGNPGYAQDNLFHHNLVEGNGNATTGGSGIGVGGNQVNVLVDHNIFRQNYQNGIVVSDGQPDFAALSKHIRVTNNILDSNGANAAGLGAGIDVETNDTILEGNQIFDSGYSGFTQNFGILIRGDGVKLLRNNVHDNATYDYSVQAATNVALIREDTTSTVQVNTNVFSGTVDTSGTAVTWQSGNLFNTRWTGVPIKINSVVYVISSVAANPTGSFTVSGLTVTRTSGPNFDSAWASAGAYIKLGSDLYFPIASVADASHLTITNPIGNTVPASGTWALRGSIGLTLASSAGTQTAVTFGVDGHVIYPNLTATHTPPTSSGLPLWAADVSAGTALSIANNATATPFGNIGNFSGLLLMTETAVMGNTALFVIGGGASVLVSAGGGAYTNTASTSGNVNVYVSGGVVTIENKRGSTISLQIYAIRTRTSS